MLSLLLLSLICHSAECALKLAFRDQVGVGLINNSSRRGTRGRRLIEGNQHPKECAADGPGTTATDCIESNPKDCVCPVLTTTEKQHILDLHNYRRDLVAGGVEPCALSSGRGQTKCPAAQDMNYLFWDPALETLSTYYAHQCEWRHQNDDGRFGDPEKMYEEQCDLTTTVTAAQKLSGLTAEDTEGCRAKGFVADDWDKAFNFVGENLASIGNGVDGEKYSMTEILESINAWFDESADYIYDEQKMWPGGKGVAQWEQAANAATRYVGCGYAVCPGGRPGTPAKFGKEEYPDWLNFVCKYYPGHVAGAYAPYTAARAGTAACSNCDSDRTGGCVASANGAPWAGQTADQKALCGGPMCAACAIEANKLGGTDCDATLGGTDCVYVTPATPPVAVKATSDLAMLISDGTVGTPLNPAARSMCVDGELTDAVNTGNTGFSCKLYEGAQWCDLSVTTHAHQGASWMTEANNGFALSSKWHDGHIDAVAQCCACGGGFGEDDNAVPIEKYPYEGDSDECEDHKITLKAGDHLPVYWVDRTGLSCRAYHYGDFCTANKTPGKGWDTSKFGGALSDQTFENGLAEKDIGFVGGEPGPLSATEACCACGGGKKAVKKATASPSRSPSDHPSRSPSDHPSRSPSTSRSPSHSPSKPPSRHIAGSPTASPVKNAVNQNGASASAAPSPSPSHFPSRSPSHTLSPSRAPSRDPSRDPSRAPSRDPTQKLAAKSDSDSSSSASS